MRLSSIVRFTFLIAALASSSLLASASADEGKLHIRFTQLRNDRGQILISLYNSAQGFPKDPKTAFKTAVIPIEAEIPEVTFDALPFGDYAIAVVHDENKNGKLDYTALGWPKEGYGASQNPPMSRRSPRFDEAQFSIDSPEGELEIQMQYFHF